MVDPQRGTYLCVTLAQSHVLRASLDSLPWIETLCADASLGSEAIRVHEPLWARKLKRTGRLGLKYQ